MFVPCAKVIFTGGKREVNYLAILFKQRGKGPNYEVIHGEPAEDVDNCMEYMEKLEFEAE